jgi:hypothetical protein
MEHMEHIPDCYLCYQIEKYIDQYIQYSFFLIFLFGFYLFCTHIEKKRVLQSADFLLSQILYIKMFIQDFYKKTYETYFMVKGFRITNIIIRDDHQSLVTSIDTQSYYKEYISLCPQTYVQIINGMNHSIQSKLNIENCYSNQSDLTICYEYDEKPYIFVYTAEMAQNGVTLPLPLYNEEIIQRFKSDIITPYYMKHSKEASLYSLFHIDCKHIKSVIYNGFEDKELLRRLNKYKGLLNDFGLMYKGKLKVKHILTPCELKELKELKIEFEAPYFDDETFDIIPHVIIGKCGEDYIVSDRIKSILEKRDLEERLEEKKKKRD